MRAIGACCFLAFTGACKTPVAPAGVEQAASSASPAPSPHYRLLAIDTPARTYFDSVLLGKDERWDPKTDEKPRLARWQGATEVLTHRTLAFTAGDVLSVAQILEFLPAAKPAAIAIDVSAPAFGAAPAPADATRAIQTALDRAKALAAPGRPVDVVIPSHTYDYSAVLEVGPDVRLRGNGGVLHATRPETSAIHLAGDRSGALFLTIRVEAGERRHTPDACGIWAGPRTGRGTPVRDTLVVGNEISGSSGAAVFGIAEHGGLWAFNHARDGFSDAFHHTGGSSGCQVIGNRATGPGTRGDDLYAFVGYRDDGDPVHHCTCIANYGQDGNTRGLSAVGAGFIEFKHNRITGTGAAGIYVAREASYDTYGSFSIFVLGNHVDRASQRATHAGLLAYADAPERSAPSRSFGEVPNAVRDLVVKDNHFGRIGGTGSRLGIEVRASCQTAEISGNVTASPTAGSR